MATPLKIGTFNVENLFSRAKVINFQNEEHGAELLEIIKQLDTELEKTEYDKPAIMALYEQVENVISIEADKGSFFKTVNGKRTVAPKGRADWYGRIVYRRDTFSDVTRRNTAKVIRAINADVLCMVEVESRPVLKEFCTDVLSSSGAFKRYTHHMLIDGNDDRGIDVSLASRFPIRNLCSHIDDKNGTREIFSRDCLEAEVVLPNGTSIWMLLNHFKSKLGIPADTAAKRKLQTTRVAQILNEKYDLKKDLVVVAGDFNDTPDSDALAPLLSVPNLFDVVKLKLADADRWTYHLNSNEQIDFLLVSKPLVDALQSVTIERRGIWKVDQFSGGTIQPFNTITKFVESASDHAAIVAEFSL